MLEHDVAFLRDRHAIFRPSSAQFRALKPLLQTFHHAIHTVASNAESHNAFFRPSMRICSIPSPFLNSMRLARSSSFLASIFGLQRASAELSSSNTTFNPLQGIQQYPISSYSGNMTRIAPVISLSHGGGPMPLLGDPSHAAITKSLKTKVPKVLKLGTPEAPKAVVLVTAHWSTSKVTVSSGSKHGLLYDYYGFPPESYEIKHDAPGSPEVAGQVAKALEEVGIECEKDAKRGTSLSCPPPSSKPPNNPQNGTTASSSR
jgi:hypothetical protein